MTNTADKDSQEPARLFVENHIPPQAPPRRVPEDFIEKLVTAFRKAEPGRLNIHRLLAEEHVERVRERAQLAALTR